MPKNTCNPCPRETGVYEMRDWVSKIPILKEIPQWGYAVVLDAINIFPTVFVAIPLIGPVIAIGVGMVANVATGLAGLALFDERGLWFDAWIARVVVSPVGLGWFPMYTGMTVLRHFKIL
jgi:hypothetical protein